jgi:large subunit ribosomal protein L7/L12
MATNQERIALKAAAAEKALEAAKRKTAELVQLKRKIQQKETAQERKNDTRRKVLLGAMYLELGGKDAELKARTIKRLNQFLTRADDRALFDLPPLPAATKPPEGEKPAD